MKTPHDAALAAVDGLPLSEPLRLELMLRISEAIATERREFNSLLQMRLAVPRMAIDKLRTEVEDLLTTEAGQLLAHKHIN